MEWDEQDHPRDDDGKFAGGGGGLATRMSQMLDTWSAGGPGDFEQMRDPTTALGKELSQHLDLLPDHVGVVYRGVAMSQKEFDRLAAGKSWNMKMTSSFSKGMETPFDMMTPHMMGDKVGVIIEAKVHKGKDISTHVPEEWQFQDEVVLKGGSKFWRVDKPTREEMHGVTFYRVKVHQRPE